MHEGDQEKIGEMRSYQNERRKVFQGERRESREKEKGCQNTKLWRKKEAESGEMKKVRKIQI